MKPGSMLFFPLFDGENSSSQASELDQLLLNFLQPFKPLAVGDLRLSFVASLTPILDVQFLKLCDLVAETGDLFAKHCQVIHAYQNSAFYRLSARAHPPRTGGTRITQGR